MSILARIVKFYGGLLWEGISGYKNVVENILSWLALLTSLGLLLFGETIRAKQASIEAVTPWLYWAVGLFIFSRILLINYRRQAELEERLRPKADLVYKDKQSPYVDRHAHGQGEDLKHRLGVIAVGQKLTDVQLLVRATEPPVPNLYLSRPLAPMASVSEVLPSTTPSLFFTFLEEHRDRGGDRTWYLAIDAPDERRELPLGEYTITIEVLGATTPTIKKVYVGREKIFQNLEISLESPFPAFQIRNTAFASSLQARFEEKVKALMSPKPPDDGEKPA